MKTTEETLGTLYDAVVEDLAKKIKDGTASAADLAVARAMLKDSGIQVARGTGSKAEKLAQVLPFSPADADDGEAQATH